MAAQICSDVSYYSTTKNASGFVRDFFKPGGDIFAILIDAGAVYGNVAPEQSAFSVSTLPRKGPHCRRNVAAPDGIAHEHNIVIRHIVHIRSWPIMLIIAISAPVKSKMRTASWGENTSPLAMTGMDTACFTWRMVVQSA